MGASKNPEFAQMQSTGIISLRRIFFICKQEIFCEHPLLGLPAYPSAATPQLGCNVIC
jgi:hypothetical protein